MILHQTVEFAVCKLTLLMQECVDQKFAFILLPKSKFGFITSMIITAIIAAIDFGGLA